MLLVGCLSGAVLAAGSAVVTISHVQAKAGDEVAVAFTISDATFANYGLTITYDDAAMTLTEVRPGAGYSGLFVPNTENGIIAYANSVNVTIGGELFIAVFRVAEDAADGVYAVDLDVDFIADETLEDLTVTVEAGSVTIGDVAAESVPPAPSEEMTFTLPEGVEEETDPLPPDASASAPGGEEEIPQQTHYAEDSNKPGDTAQNDGASAQPGGSTALYIAAGVMALALIAIVVILILKRRTAK